MLRLIEMTRSNVSHTKQLLFVMESKLFYNRIYYCLKLLGAFNFGSLFLGFKCGSLVFHSHLHSQTLSLSFSPSHTHIDTQTHPPSPLPRCPGNIQPFKDIYPHAIQKGSHNLFSHWSPCPRLLVCRNGDDLINR